MKRVPPRPQFCGNRLSSFRVILLTNETGQKNTTGHFHFSISRMEIKAELKESDRPAFETTRNDSYIRERNTNGARVNSFAGRISITAQISDIKA